MKKPVWLSPDGTPLSFVSVEEILQFLATAKLRAATRRRTRRLIRCGSETCRQDRKAGTRRGRKRAATRLLEIVTLALMLNAPLPVAGVDLTFSGERQSKRAARAVSGAQLLALKQLSQRPACRALFEELGYSGAQLVADATFRIASRAESRQICHRGGGALFTTVGGSEISLCLDVFLWMPARTQAAMLLHEALHHAGVSEQPWDPDGLTSAALTQLVERKCKLIENRFRAR